MKKIKKITLIFTFCLLSFTFYLSSNTWVKTYQPFGDEFDYFVEDIRICPDDGYAVIGSIWNSEFSTNDGFMIKTDSDGNLLWASIDTVSFISGPEPSGFVVLDDSSFITLGNNFWFGGHYLLKRNSNGIIEWTVELDNDYSVQAIELTNDGNMVTTGSSMDNTINLQKFDLEGNLIWRGTYLPSGFTYGGGYSVIATSDGGYALTGVVNGPNNWDILVIKTDESGDSLWTWTYNNSPYNYDDMGQCIIENSEGDYLICGYISDYDSRDYFGYLVKMNSIGDTIWTGKINGMSAINSLVQSQDNNYILQGNNITKIRDNQEIIWQVPRLVDLNASGDRTILERSYQDIIYLGKHYWGDYITIVKCDSTGQVTAIDENNIFPLESNLRCYPNPFCNSTIISFLITYHTNLHSLSEVRIYNIKGQLVKELQIINYKLQINEVIWDGKDINGNVVSNGIYFLMLEGDNYTTVKKVMKIK